MEMLDKLRSFKEARAETDEIALMLGSANLIISSYESVSQKAPAEWTDIRDRLSRALTDRHRDIMEERLAELRRRKQALMTREQKAAAADAEIAELENLLGKK